MDESPFSIYLLVGLLGILDASVYIYFAMYLSVYAPVRSCV